MNRWTPRTGSTRKSERHRPRLHRLEDRVVPATFVVSNTNNDGAGSLRQAILDANAAPGDDVIDATGVTGTISLLTALPTISGEVSILGPGPDKLTVTRDATAASFRIFNVNIGGIIGKVTFSGLKITNGNLAAGNGGGLFLADEKVSIINCEISGNKTAGQGGGFAFGNNPGTLTLTNSIVTGNSATNGGGAYWYNNGGLVMTGSTVSGNSASGQGGGLYFFANANSNWLIRNSTISGNSAGIEGGGIAMIAGGNVLTLQNSTVSNNSADPGGTKSGVGGGIFADKAGIVINLESSVVSKNANLLAPEISSPGKVNAKTSNIFDLTGIALFNDQGGNQLGQDPLLNPLAFNGGTTQTHSFKAGSPLLDSGSNSTFQPLDQRGPGYVRAFNNIPDIGAYEEQVFGSPWATGQFASVTTAGGTSYSFKVVYEDVAAIDVSTLGTGDVTVTGPGGAITPVVFKGVDVPSNGSPRVATYEFTPPGGSWDGSDNGKYVVAVAANQVKNTGGKSAAAVPIGTFNVALPATYIVNATNDESVDTDGKLSLREAIQLANANSPQVDTILFDPVVFAGTVTISLFEGEIPITDGVKINGPTPNGPADPRLTVDAGFSSRIFNINEKFGTSTFTFSNLRLVNGVSSGSGGAVFFASTDEVASFTDCAFDSNQGNNMGGAIGSANNGGVLLDLTIVRCKFTNNLNNLNFGGAVGIDASVAAGAVTRGNRVTILDSVFDGNTDARNGGAVFVRTNGPTVADGGRLTVDGCSFTKNVSIDGFGAAISILTGPGGPIIIRNSTFSGNESPGSVSGQGSVIALGNGFSGDVFFQNCTLAFNSTQRGGAVAQTSGLSKISFESCIIYNNTAGSGPHDFSGGNIIAKTSIIFNKSGGSSFTDLGGNKYGAAADPLLQPLTNAGSLTFYHLPGPFSPAREAGSNPAGLTTDQRGPGFPRQLGTAVDIGAIESIDPNPIAASSPANVLVGGGTVYEFDVIYSDDVAIKVASLKTGNVTVTGPGGPIGPVTFVKASPNTDGTPITATYQFTPPGGSWDKTDNGTYTIAIAAAQVFDNSGNAVKAGDIASFVVGVPSNIVVNAVNDEATDTDGKISLREAVLLANGLQGSADSITFDPALFSTAQTIKLSLGELLITDSVHIIGPSKASLVTISGEANSRIFNLDGAGILVVNLSGLTLANGNAFDNGGAILNSNEVLTINNLVFTGNKSNDRGGAIFLASAAATLVVSDSTFKANESQTVGGAVSTKSNSSMTFTRVSFLGNKAVNGGAVATETGNLIFDSSLLANNEALGDGGAVFTDNAMGILIYRNTTISSNTAQQNGGGIYSSHYGGAMQLLNSTVFNNTAGNEGGGIFNNKVAIPPGPFNFVSSIVAGNKALVINSDLSAAVQTNYRFSIVGVRTGTGAFVDDGNNQPLGTNPLLGPLQDNGGPTLTHALLTGSPAIDAGDNPNNFLFDQRGVGFPRVSGKQADIGAFEFQVAAAAPQVSTVVINGGAAQRSRVTSVQVTFDQAVTLPMTPETAFQLKRQSDSAVVTISGTVDNSGPGTVVTLTFTGGAVEAGSLADGRYTLTILAANVTGPGGQLDGNGDGTGGDDFVLVGNPAAAEPNQRLFRLFGDADGNGTVNFADFLAFRTTFGLKSVDANFNAAFDSNNDGVVDFSDFLQFRTRFGTSI